MYQFNLETCTEHKDTVIVFSKGSACPLCDASDEIEKMQREHDDLESQVSALEDEVSDLHNETEKLREERDAL